ncbi:hypothetical protein OROMI_020347 [Orobanche minor]
MFMLPELASGAETELTLNEMAINMKSKWLKYFGTWSNINHMEIVGLVLDARFKLKNVTFNFRIEGLTENEVEQRTTDIRKLLIDLYNQYVVVDGGKHLPRPTFPSSSSGSITSTGSSNSRNQILSNWKKVVQETKDAVTTHEVDQYLDAPLELTEDEEKFDILLWWKVNDYKFLVLAAIAKDVLAIQTSTVASESCFSTGGRVIDCFSSSLTTKTVEGLICTQNWLLGDDVAEVEELTIHNLEFYESIEEDFVSSISSRRKGKALPPKVPNSKGKSKSITTDV